MKTENKKKRTGLYFIGGCVLAAGAMMIAPKVIEFVADQFDNAPPQETKNDDDWGPEIVRREKPMKEKENGEF